MVIQHQQASTFHTINKYCTNKSHFDIYIISIVFNYQRCKMKRLNNTNMYAAAKVFINREKQKKKVQNIESREIGTLFNQ